MASTAACVEILFTIREKCGSFVRYIKGVMYIQYCKSERNWEKRYLNVQLTLEYVSFLVTLHSVMSPIVSQVQLKISGCWCSTTTHQKKQPSL